MVQWAHKLRRSGYTATFRHQVIGAALRRWKRMCREAEEGIRPIHRPRDWKRKDRRMAKVGKKSNWHQAKPGQASAPLILDPIPGDMLEKMKTVRGKFEQTHGIRVLICKKAGSSVRRDAKPEPLRKSEFHQGPLVRVVATTGLQEEQTTAASQGVGTGASTNQGGQRMMRGRGRGRGGRGPAVPGRARRRAGRGE